MADNGAQSEPCPSQMELASYLDGRLADDDRRRLEDHLALCDECLEAVCEARALLIVTGTPDVPASVAEQARALVAEPARVHVEHRRIATFRVFGEWGLAAAAAIVLCVFSYHAGTRSAEGPAVAADDLVSAVSFGALDLDDGFELEMESVLLAQEAVR